MLESQTLVGVVKRTHLVQALQTEPASWAPGQQVGPPARGGQDGVGELGCEADLEEFRDQGLEAGGWPRSQLSFALPPALSPGYLG
jgi:hypothetical protein